MFGEWNHLTYGASKAAVDQITRNMALEYAQKGIRVNSINPTVVNTDMAKSSWANPVLRDRILSRYTFVYF